MAKYMAFGRDGQTVLIDEDDYPLPAPPDGLIQLVCSLDDGGDNLDESGAIDFLRRHGATMVGLGYAKPDDVWQLIADVLTAGAAGETARRVD